MVKLIDLSHNFESKELFTNLNHEFGEGIHAICGRSGCGKTTLLRIIAGLEQQTSGEVLADRPISFSFQDSVLFPWYTAKKNIELVSDSETAIELLREFELEKDINTLPAHLSGGMKNRVSIARALAFNSKTILLDEPFAGLDMMTANKSLNIISRHTKGKTVLISTHNMDIASKLDSILYL